MKDGRFLRMTGWFFKQIMGSNNKALSDQQSAVRFNLTRFAPLSWIFNAIDLRSYTFIELRKMQNTNGRAGLHPRSTYLSTFCQELGIW